MNLDDLSPRHRTEALSQLRKIEQVPHVKKPIVQLPKKGRVEKTRNGGTITEAAYWQMLRSGLRRTFRWWKPAIMALNQSRIAMKGPRGQKWAYLCVKCQKLYLRKSVQIDHIEECGSLRSYEDISGFIQRLTPESSTAFQLLCKECHTTKTNTTQKSKNEA